VKPSPKAVRACFFSTLLFLLLSWCLAVLPASAQSVQVTSANPSSAPQGAVNVNVTVNGKGFKKGLISHFLVAGTTSPGGITVNSTTFVSSSQLTSNISVAKNATIASFDIVVQNTDGSTGKGTELFAVTAPDPAIAYTVSAPSKSDALKVMNADGTNQLQIFFASSGLSIYYSRPDWSPDHSQLVFPANLAQGPGIYVINKDGTNLHMVIATNDWYFNDPQWSPAPITDTTGTNYKIAFADRLSGQPCRDLYLVNVDGSGLQNLTNTPGRDEFYPTWAPDARRLASQSWACVNSTTNQAYLYEYDVSVVNGTAQITNTTNLTAAGQLSNADIYTPSWAKAHDEIVVAARLLSDINNTALWVVSLAAPANPVEFSATYQSNGLGRPSWAPDDSKIVFGNGTIYEINADGSGLTNLGVAGYCTAWRRCCSTCTVMCAP